MRFAINVDLENLNRPDNVPTDCAFHPFDRPHYDITIHRADHARATNRTHRYWITGLPTLTQARERAEAERARLAENLPVLVREHSCVSVSG